MFECGFSESLDLGKMPLRERNTPTDHAMWVVCVFVLTLDHQPSQRRPPGSAAWSVG